MRAQQFAGLAAVVLSACVNDPASSSPSAAPSSADASAEASSPGPSADECSAIQQTAIPTFEKLAAPYYPMPCNVDADCFWTAYTMMTSQGSVPSCFAGCGLLADQQNEAAINAAASQACEPYVAAGCAGPGGGPMCSNIPSLICNDGSCGYFEFGVTPLLKTFARGTCAPFAIEYAGEATIPSGGGSSAPLSPERTVTVVSSGATLYADLSCTQPLPASGALTMPAGYASAPLGVVPSGGGFSVGVEPFPWRGFSGTAP